MKSIGFYVRSSDDVLSLGPFRKSDCDLLWGIGTLQDILRFSLDCKMHSREILTEEKENPGAKDKIEFWMAMK